MDIKKLQKKINYLDYWDCKVLDFQINYFGDEVKVVVEGDNKVDYIIKFLICYKVNYETEARERWQGMQVKSMNKSQLGYYAHEINIKESEVDGFIEVDLRLPFLFAKIMCKDICIEQVAHSEDIYFWSKNI